MTTVYQTKYFCKNILLDSGCSVISNSFKISKYTFQNNYKNVALLYENLVSSNQHFYFYTVTFKTTEVVYAIRIGKHPSVFRALQHLSSKSNVGYN